MVVTTVPNRALGVTTQELCDTLGWSEKRVRKALGRLQRKGRLVVTYGKRTTIVGSQCLVPVYRVRAEQSGGNDG